MTVSLSMSSFAKYPSQARALAERNLDLFRTLPPAFLALLLREVKGYDWLFPMEQRELLAQLDVLRSKDGQDLTSVMQQFAATPLSPALRAADVGSDPEGYVEQLTAWLWSVHAIDRFRQAGTAYGEILMKVRDRFPTPKDRWCIVLAGQGSQPRSADLFDKLRPHGTHFISVDTRGASSVALRFLERRAQASPAPYAHWYLEGGRTEDLSTTNASVLSYESLTPMRRLLLQRMERARTSGTVGPEDLRSLMTQMKPSDFEALGVPDERLQHFTLRLLTEGSGTQIFSTTFIQWAARETIRRASPETMVIRYAPRQINRPMNELLGASSPEAVDPEGSLRDAEMGAYYTWLNLLRAPTIDGLRFLVLQEGGTQAIAIAPGCAAGSRSTTGCDLARIQSWMI